MYLKFNFYKIISGLWSLFCKSKSYLALCWFLMKNVVHGHFLPREWHSHHLLFISALYFNIISPIFIINCKIYCLVVFFPLFSCLVSPLDVCYTVLIKRSTLLLLFYSLSNEMEASFQRKYVNQKLIYSINFILHIMTRHKVTSSKMTGE